LPACQLKRIKTLGHATTNASERINEDNLLVAGNKLNLPVKINTAMKVKGEFWARKNLLYVEFQDIQPLYTEESRPINLTLDPQVVFNL